LRFKTRRTSEINILSFDWDKWKKDPSKWENVEFLVKGDKEGIALVPALLMKRIAIYIKTKNFSSLDSRIFVRGNTDINLKNKVEPGKINYVKRA